jgi:hypothetical protein
MNKQQYKAYRRSMRDNGTNYTIEHAPKYDGWTLARLDILANTPDLLEWRVRWLGNPDTNAKNIIKLTSPLL